jgi:hypothetical protein
MAAPLTPPHRFPAFSRGSSALSKFRPIPSPREGQLGQMSWFFADKELYVVTSFCGRDGVVNEALVRQEAADAIGHLVSVDSPLFSDVRLPRLNSTAMRHSAETPLSLTRDVAHVAADVMCGLARVPASRVRNDRHLPCAFLM